MGRAPRDRRRKCHRTDSMTLYEPATSDTTVQLVAEAASVGLFLMLSHNPTPALTFQNAYTGPGLDIHKDGGRSSASITTQRVSFSISIRAVPSNDFIPTAPISSQSALLVICGREPSDL